MGVMTLAISGLAAACGSSTPPSETATSTPAPAGSDGAPASAAPTNAATGQTVMIAPPVANNVYWDAYSAAAAYAAATLGMQSHYANFNGDTNAQIAAFENAPTLGISGAITMANQAAVSPQLFGTAQANNTKVVNSWSNQPWSTPLDIGDQYLQYLEISNDRSYEVLAELVFEKLSRGPARSCTSPVRRATPLPTRVTRASPERSRSLPRHRAPRQPVRRLLEDDDDPIDREPIDDLPGCRRHPLPNNGSPPSAPSPSSSSASIDPLIVGYDAVPEIDRCDRGRRCVRHHREQRAVARWRGCRAATSMRSTESRTTRLSG